MEYVQGGAEQPPGSIPVWGVSHTRTGTSGSASQEDGARERPHGWRALPLAPGPLPSSTEVSLSSLESLPKASWASLPPLVAPRLYLRSRTSSSEPELPGVQTARRLGLPAGPVSPPFLC